MKKLSFLVSVTHHLTDYPKEQAFAAEEAAKRLGVDVKIVSADNDAVAQSQQILQVVQASHNRPDAVICHPVGTGLEQVAQAACQAGIGWALLNRKVDYLARLRRTYKVPVFGLTVDYEEAGRIQAQQVAALLPEGGTVLYLEGLMLSPAARALTIGMTAGKPANVQIRTLRGQWTEQSGFDAVKNWLALATSHNAQVGAFAAQNDDMAMGARRAFQEYSRNTDRDRWTQIPFTGCYACSRTGQEWVRQGQLTASVLIPPSTGQAMEMLVRYFQGSAQPPEETLVPASSFPPLEELGRHRARGLHA